MNSIVLRLHDGISSDKRDTDTREPTVAAVRRLVPALLERGLRPVTVSQLLRFGPTRHSTAFPKCGTKGDRRWRRGENSRR